MALIDFIRSNFLPSSTSCRYKAGDQVQSIHGGPLMIVEWVKPSSQKNTFMICCKWFDRKTKKNQIDVFVDHEIKPFDWYNPD